FQKVFEGRRDIVALEIRDAELPANIQLLDRDSAECASGNPGARRILRQNGHAESEFHHFDDRFGSLKLHDDFGLEVVLFKETIGRRVLPPGSLRIRGSSASAVIVTLRSGASRWVGLITATSLSLRSISVVMSDSSTGSETIPTSMFPARICSMVRSLVPPT